MNLDVETLTKSLSEYSSEANNASNAISKGLLSIGLIIIAIFFLIEYLNWKHIFDKNNKRLGINIFLEFAVKYLIGVMLLLTSGLILDAIMEISIVITKTVSSIYPPNTFILTYEEADFGGWIINGMMNAVGWIIEKITGAIVYILIFMRYVDLYFLKALAPILIGFYYSDEFRPVVMNFFKSFIAYCLLAVVLLIFTIIFGMLITTDIVNDDNSAWLAILKGVIYILIVTGSVRKVKSLVGVQ